MPFFTPPTADIVPAIRPETRGVQRRLFRYYGPNPRGLSIVFRAGHYVTVMNPTQDELATLTDGLTYFLGGHVYPIGNDVAALLTADGYTVSTTEWGELTGTWGSYASDTWGTIG